MIFWADEGMILSVRTHGENAVILEVLTEGHGRHGGVVRGGASRKMRPHLQPGAQVAVEWQARLEEHLGGYKVEPLRSRAGAVMGDRLALEGLGAICGILGKVLPEREAVPEIYKDTIGLVERFGAEDWLKDYALWEVRLLSALGFALDLSACAVTGKAEDLVYVSPKSGRAVSREGAGEWAKRLLPLPAFLREPETAAADQDLCDALRLCGFFLENQVIVPAGGKGLPAARERLADLAARRLRGG